MKPAVFALLLPWLVVAIAPELAPETVLAQSLKPGRAKIQPVSTGSCFLRGANGKNVDLSALCGVDGSTASRNFFQIPIKRRKAGTPVIDVTFDGKNGKQTFEMIVDTGASGTVITQSMAQALGVTPVRVVKVNTASEKGAKILLGYVLSIQVGDISTDRVLVGIQPALDVGLLGHDFFGNMEMTVKRDVVEFRIPN